jgi:hypothetical protein
MIDRGPGFLAGGHMIRLLAHPLPPFPVSKLSLFSQSSYVPPFELTAWRGGGEGVQKSQIVCALTFASEAKFEIEVKISFRLEAKKKPDFTW